MKRHGLSLVKLNKGQFTPVYATPNDWHKPTGNRSSRIGSGYYNMRRHAYVRR